MKKITKKLLLISAILSTSNAHAILNVISPYVGGGYAWTKMEGLVKSYNGGNFFIGMKLCVVGIEGGYDCAKKKHSASTIPILSSFIAPLDLGVQSKTITAKIKTTISEGWHLDLNSYFPISDCLELIGSIGFEKMKVSCRIDVRTVNALLDGNPSRNINNSVVNGVFVAGNNDSTTSFANHRNKAVLRLGAGAEYMIFNTIGLRGILRCKKTSKLKITMPQDAIVSTARHFITPTDALSLEVSVFARF